MAKRIYRPKKNTLYVYDCLAFLVGGMFAFPFLLVLTLPLITDF